jgi:hypothetical protein
MAQEAKHDEQPLTTEPAPRGDHLEARRRSLSVVACHSGEATASSRYRAPDLGRRAARDALCVPPVASWTIGNVAVASFVPTQFSREL